MLHDLANWMMSWAASPYGGLALFGFAFVESIFFPIPPDALMITLGVAAPPMALVFAAIATVASVFGGITGYYVGKTGGRPLVLRMFGQDKVAYVQDLYQRYDVWAVAIAGFTPLPYKLFTLSAGVLLLNPKRFLIASLIGRAARFFLVGTLIFAFGETIQFYLLKYLDLAAIAFVGLLVAGFVVVSLVARRRPRADRPEQGES